MNWSGCLSWFVIVFVVSSVQLRGAEALVLYTSACQVEKGRSVDVVIEVRNAGTEVVEVSPDVRLLRLVAPESVRVPTKEQGDNDSRDRRLHLTVLCTVPSGYPKRKLLTGNVRRMPQKYSALPGMSAFLKVTMPAAAFEIGRCKIVVVCSEDENKSQELELDCREEAEGR